MASWLLRPMYSVQFGAGPGGNQSGGGYSYGEGWQNGGLISGDGQGNGITYRYGNGLGNGFGDGWGQLYAEPE
jgi:hypothetical protein